MNLRSLEYAVAESVHGITHNALMSVASVTTIALTLSMLGGFVLVVLGINNFAQTQLSDIEISVWLDSSKTEDDISELERRIGDLAYVASTDFMSADRTWEDILKRSPVDAAGVQPDRVMKELDYFRVRLTDAKYAERAVSDIKGMPHVKEVVEALTLVNQLIQFAKMVKLLGGIATGILLFIAIFVSSNAIRLTVYARRREINIMALVGATNWFIRMPFLLEGMILGVIGGGIAGLLVYGGSRYLADLAVQTFPLIAQLSSPVDPYWFYGSLLGLGCILGAMSSAVSIRRYLKV